MTLRLAGSLIPGKFHMGFRGLGVLGSTIPATGDSGPGFGYPSVEADDLTAELWFEVVTWPVGVFEPDEYTRFTYTGPSSSFTFRKWRNGVDEGMATATLTVGQAAPGPGEETPQVPAIPAGAGGHGFEMVSMEPTWRRALRMRAEKAEKVEFTRKARKRAELIEKLAAKAVLSDKPDDEIKERIGSLLAEWVELAPKLDLPAAGATSPDSAFLSRVAEHIRRLDLEDDEQAAIMLLLMYAA